MAAPISSPRRSIAASSRRATTPRWRSDVERPQSRGSTRIPPGISRRRRRLYRRTSRALKPFAKRVPALRPVRRALRSPHPIGFLRAWRAGREFFDYPGTRSLLSLTTFRPDLVHLHNLHAEYFDLRYLPELSTTVPVAMTLHDEWTYTGHCAYTMGIDRWQTGCGGCPDLRIYPKIAHDGTHENWLAKQAIYERSRLYVSAPSSWLLDRARRSMLADGSRGLARHPERRRPDRVPAARA